MKIDINKLAEHYARTNFQVEVVYRGLRQPGDQAHDYNEPFPGFVFPLCGKAECMFEDTNYLLSQGTVVHGGSKMESKRKALGDSKWEYLLVLYKICGEEPPEMELAKCHFELCVGTSPRLSELLEKLWKVANQPGSIPKFQTEVIFRNILEEMFICVRNREKGGGQELFNQICDYLHANYMNTITIPWLSEQNGINRNQLAYLFYKYAGIGPGDYLLQYRLNCAKALILSSHGNVKEVGQAVGFTDPYYFSKAFKKKFGCAPSKYQENFLNIT